MAKASLKTALYHLLDRLRSSDKGDRTDRELLDRFSSNRDEGAFAALVQRHGSFVLGVGRRVLGEEHASEDVFQATFLVLAQKARSLDRERSLGNWLYTVA
jgi:DNA-directed RNA polymerase specialized sigma24 family protein